MALGQKFRFKLQQKLPRVMLHPGQGGRKLMRVGSRLPPPQAIQPVMSYEYARSQVDI